MRLYLSGAVKPKRPNGYYPVLKSDGDGFYMVRLRPEMRCNCWDFKKRKEPCKHIWAVIIYKSMQESEDREVVNG